MPLVPKARTQVTEEERKKAASQLIGTRIAPLGLGVVAKLSMEATAYSLLSPYPFFNFWDWKTEERGPLPKCMPFTMGVTRKGAKWLFGKPIQLTIKGNEELQEFIQKAWKANKMPTRMVAAAEKGSVEGTVVVKYTWDPTSAVPLKFQILSPVTECRMYYDPHDSSVLLMMRIQYPYRSDVDGKWWFHREEHTDNEVVYYKPVPAKIVKQTVRQFEYQYMYVTTDNKSPDDFAEWQIEKREANPLGIIPAQEIKNKEAGGQWGAGDLWGLYRIIDRINLCYHLMDRSNQFDSEPTPVYIDLIADSDSLDKPLAPGNPLSLKTDNASDGAEMRQGKVELLEPQGKLRVYMENYAKDLRMMVYDAAGYVEIHQSEVTNKGNLTQAVLAQLYAPLIEATEEKRKTYGDEGLCVFFQKVAVGLTNYGKADKFPKIKDLTDIEAYTPQIKWPDYFELTEAEKLIRVERLAFEEESGYTDHEHGVRSIASMEQWDDVEELVDKLKDWKPTPEVEADVSAAVGKRTSRANAKNLKVNNKDGGASA